MCSSGKQCNFTYSVHAFTMCHLGTVLTYSMVQSPSWEANCSAPSQEIPRISRNPKAHYRTHKRPPPVSILGQPNPVHLHTSHLLEIRSNIIRPSTQGLPSSLLPSSFPTKTLYTPLSSLIHTTCPAHLILLNFITRTILGEEYMSISPSLCNLLHSPITSSLLGPNILLNTNSSEFKIMSNDTLCDSTGHVAQYHPQKVWPSTWLFCGTAHKSDAMFMCSEPSILWLSSQNLEYPLCSILWWPRC